jgi:T5orf172 domain
MDCPAARPKGCAVCGEALRSESFYKVGITFCLFSRFRSLRFAGYKWRTVARFSSYNAGRVFDIEQRLHRELAGLSTPRCCRFPVLRSAILRAGRYWLRCPAQRLF